MKRSESKSATSPARPIERPSWRFSGRRGTPVHLRERTPANLPPEIQQVVAQMAREQAGERSATAATPKVRAAATSSLDLSGKDRPTPPVAGAPMPVERRTDAGTPGSQVTTTAPEAVPAPAPLKPAEPPVTTESTNGPEESEQPRLSEAERRKLAKARARAKAKADAENAGKRRLFAPGREVDAETESVAVEPVAVEPVAAEPLAAEPLAVEPAEVHSLTAQSSEAPDPTPVAVDIDHVDLGSDRAAATPTSRPEPRAASDMAGQAAWELGRLPILLAPTIRDTTIAARDESGEPELVIPSGSTRARMRPIEWEPISSQPSPAPIEPTGESAPLPDEIAYLVRSGPTSRLTRAHTSGLSSTASDAEATRERIARRRRELEDVVASLSAIVEHATH